MTKYLVTNVGNYGFAGIGINLDESQSADKERVYLDDLFKKLGTGNGEGDEIFLSRYSLPYKKVIAEKYLKATITVIDEF
ncbi:hypothetical protein [Lapidilactobacillus bayanensis]|uniref:hypothetical protein n=1 Tax=Lapidilactobacillus bayanensis TaxID=2485998 RepID=UPI000F7B9E70|nr:hypothetical protein [Lapidilactobacillus bayanensis]